MQTTTRKSLPLDSTLAALVSAIRTPGTPERAAVETIIGPLPEGMSEAAAMVTLLTLGADAVREAMLYAAYAADAAAQDDEDRAFAQAVRARRARRAEH